MPKQTAEKAPPIKTTQPPKKTSHQIVNPKRQIIIYNPKTIIPPTCSILIVAQWCHHSIDIMKTLSKCKTTEPVIQVDEQYESRINVPDKMSGFPRLYNISPGKKPILFKGERTETNLTNFINRKLK